MSDVYIPKSLRSKVDIDYWHKLSRSEKEWYVRFLYDMYAGGVYKDGTVLEGEAMKKEARKNHNSLSRDMYDVSSRQGSLGTLDEADRQFMEHASDEIEWRDVYDRDGYGPAADTITDQTIKDLSNKLVDKKTTLLRFFEKMTGLKRLYKRDRNQKRSK